MEAPAEITTAAGLEPLVATPPASRGRVSALAGIWVPAAMLIVIFFLCFVWPLIGPVPSPTDGNILYSNLPSFSPGHLLGTDATGKDEWSRLLYGGRASLEIALAVNAIGLIFGGGIGAAAGVWGGWRDSVVMRMLDVVIAFPALVLALAIAEGLGPSEFHAIIALCFFSVPAFARLARAATLRVREQNYIVAAGLSGAGSVRTLIGHITPNILPQLMTFAFLGMGITIILEGALSFLGLGIPPPAPSWGNMIAQGQGILSAEPKYVLLPSAALFITVVAFNLLGDGLRTLWSER